MKNNNNFDGIFVYEETAEENITKIDFAVVELING